MDVFKDDVVLKMTDKTAEDVNMLTEESNSNRRSLFPESELLLR